MLKILAIVIISLSFTVFFLAQKNDIENINSLRPYKEKLCKEFNGKLDALLYDNTKADCLSQEYVIEVGYAKDWQKLIGKVLYSSQLSTKKPVIAIIGDDEIAKLKSVALRQDIKVIELKQTSLAP